MKTLVFLSATIIILLAGMMNQPVLGQENQRDTTQVENVRVDTVFVEKVRVDTVYVEKANAEPQQNQNKETEKKPQESKGRNPKVYYGGHRMIAFNGIDIDT